MKKMMFLSLSLLLLPYANAALPPRYQNMRDLDVMVSFIKNHPRVAEGLVSIDFRRKFVYYSGHCKAVFGRKERIKPPGWVGPADPLEFKHSNCKIDY